MIIYEDTRQKKAKHGNIHAYCRSNKIKLVPKCLNVGDYMLPNGKTAVDTKQNILECANDLYRDKICFFKKYKKCLKEKIQLIVLVEEPVENIAELNKWKSPHGKIDGNFLIRLMKMVEISYNVKFCFCEKSKTGETLIQLLKGDIYEKN